MAKLSAHGTEVARFSKEHETPESTLTSWSKTTYAIMSDGAVLQKRDVRFRPADYEKAQYPNGRLSSYGWKKHNKAKLLVVDDNDLIEKFTSFGWTREK